MTASPAVPTTGGQLLSAISNDIVRLVREYTGRGPTTARTTIRDNVVVVMLEDSLTKGEQSLVLKGRPEKVLEIRPDDPAAMNAYGYTLADHGKSLAQARRLIERAYAAAPKNAAIQDSLGWVLYRQGHAEQALPYLTAAYADDRGADIAAHYGEVLWTVGRRDDADRIWTEAGAADSSNRLLNATRQRLHDSK